MLSTTEGIISFASSAVLNRDSFKYELNQIIENLYEQSWADDESLIYLESNECLDKLVSPKYQLIRDSKAGNVYYGILKLTTQSSKK